MGRLIGDAEDALNSGRPNDARVLLSRAQQSSRVESSVAEKSQILTLLADCELRARRFQQAARNLFEAHSIDPDSERTTVNLPTAHLLAGNRPEAARAAADATRKFPGSGAAWATRLQCCEPDKFASTLALVPDELRLHAEVTIVVAMNYMYLGREDAEQLVVEATQRAPQDARSWLALGSFLGNREIGKCAYGEPPGDTAVSREHLLKADDALGKAVKFARDRDDMSMLLSALLARINVRYLLEDLVGAGDDLRECLRLQPNETRVVRMHAEALAIRGELSAAIEELERALRESDEERGELEFALASALWNRNRRGDRESATRAFVELASAAEPVRRGALLLAFDGLLFSKRFDDARNLLERSPPAGVLAHVLKARLLAACDSREQALLEAKAAQEGWSVETARDVSTALARLLGQLGQHAGALVIWERLALAGEATTVCNLLECAGRLGRHDIVLAYSRAFRDRGGRDDRILSWELWILQQYDPSEGLKLLLELQRDQLANKDLALQIASTGLRLGLNDLAREQVERLPAVDEVGANAGAQVVGVLIGLGLGQKAAMYSYDLLRRHFNSSRVHMAFLEAVLFGDRQEAAAGRGKDVAESGTMVFVREEAREGEWVSLVPEAQSGDWAHTLIGRRVGDVVTLEIPGSDRRNVTIVHVARGASAGSAVAFKEVGAEDEQWVVLEDSNIERGPDVPGEFRQIRSVRASSSVSVLVTVLCSLLLRD